MKADYLDQDKYFFDTYAIFEILHKNINYEKYITEPIITSLLNLGELYYGFLKDGNKNSAEEWKKKLENCIIGFDSEIIAKAMNFRYANKKKNFSFIDCVGYTIAAENKLIFLTGDEQFKRIANVEFVK